MGRVSKITVSLGPTILYLMALVQCLRSIFGLISLRTMYGGCSVGLASILVAIPLVATLSMLPLIVPALQRGRENAKEKRENWLDRGTLPGVGGSAAAEILDKEYPPVFKGGQVVKVSRFGFRLEVPRKFEEQPAADRSTVLSYHRYSSLYGVSYGVIVGRLGTRLRGEKLTAAEAKSILADAVPGAIAQLREDQWMGRPVQTVQVHMQEGIRELIGYATILPLKKEAMCVLVAGPREKADTVKEMHRRVLLSFKGVPEEVR